MLTDETYQLVPMPGLFRRELTQRLRFTRSEYGLGEMGRLEKTARAEGHGTCQRLFQLADVQRPAVSQDRLPRLRGELHVRALGCELFQEKHQQQRNVLGTVAERGEPERDAIKARQKVVPESPFPDQALQDRKSAV